MISIKEFMEEFDISDEDINELQKNSFNKKTGKYRSCYVKVYREKGGIRFCGIWSINFNNGYCYLEDF